jgi:DNA-binding transcriptional LysR family regulator
LPTDYFEGPIMSAIADFRSGHPDVQMQISTDASDSLLRDLRRGEFDLVVAASDMTQAAEARRSWREENAWAASSRAVFDTDRPVPLAVLGENSLARRLAIAALEQAGQPYEIVYIGGSFAGLVEAVNAGLGVACWAKRLLRQSGLEVFDSAPQRLPPIPDVHGGVYLREGSDGSPLCELADMIAAAVARPASEAGAQAMFASPFRKTAGLGGIC